MHALKTLTLLRLEICCEKVNIWLTVSRRDSISKCQNVKRWSSPVWWSVLKNTHTGTSGCGCVSTYDHCYVCSIDWLLSFLLHCYLHTWVLLPIISLDFLETSSLLFVWLLCVFHEMPSVAWMMLYKFNILVDPHIPQEHGRVVYFYTQCVRWVCKIRKSALFSVKLFTEGKKMYTSWWQMCENFKTWVS